MMVTSGWQQAYSSTVNAVPIRSPLRIHSVLCNALAETTTGHPALISRERTRRVGLYHTRPSPTLVS